ncbi:MAG TPA: hypothetical protein VFU29_19245 [Chitinophagaceae bacterium]|nr:hypothetical protein [Chitinophagaceae bacterium]
MEVHTHAHTPRKKWTHYLWEFLMLFLAVFCGFLAENKREKIVERHREKDYIISMIEDLQTDTANLSLVITGFDDMERRFDFTIRGFNDGIKTFSEDWTQKFILSFRGGYPDFYQSDRTIQQLKNAGGMRLILNKTAAKGIINYDEDVKDLDLEVTSMSRGQDRYIEEVLKVWSINKMYKEAGTTSWAKTRNLIIHNNYWITNDPVAFEHLFNRLSEYNEATVRMDRNFHDLKTKAISLIELLKKEYHLQ